MFTSIDRPLKLVALEPSGCLYGSEYCLLDIIDGLPRDRYAWHVVLPRGGGFDRLLLDRGIACEFLLPTDLGSVPYWRKMLVYVNVLRRLNRLKPDLLYVNQAGSLRAAAMYARCLRLPVVCQVQTLEDAQMLGNNPARHGAVRAFVCNSEFIAAETRCDPLKKCVLYQGLPVTRVAHARYLRSSPREPDRRVGEQHFVIGILGRIAVSKGHYLLLEAAAQLQKLLSEWRIVVIGAGLTPKNTREFEEAVSRSGLGPRFEFRGYRTDVAAELAGVDLLVIPSLAEPLGRVLFDAAEYAVPVVVSDAGGLGELSRRFDVGLRFRSGDAAALAHALTDAANNYPALRERFKAASLSMLEQLSMTSYLATVERILLAAAQKRNSCEIWLGDE